MVNTLLGIKKEMTSVYDSRGRRVGATVVQILPNLVTQIKTTHGKDGYDAVQLGYGTKKSVKKPQLGHGRKAGIKKPIRWLREVRVAGQDSLTDSTVSATSSSETLKPGQEIKLSQVFSIGDAVKVTGVSKGKGFQGGMRRHGFHGGPRTHGQSDRMRAPGAIGSGTTPGRVYKGKKMAGHMGSSRASVKNLEIVGLNKNDNSLVIKGAVPGSVNNLVLITKLGKIKGYTLPSEEKSPEEEEVKIEAGESGQAQKEQKTEQPEKQSQSEPKEKENAS
ncbi:50S ribosomal protein L3 [Patescibacteria group bacterium]|nr:50S ribosomal protein L3 [Patescibacteria group bacterium]